jgi:hypothetical protein
MLEKKILISMISDEVSVVNINGTDYILKKRKDIKKSQSIFEYFSNLFNLSFIRELHVNLAIINTPFVSHCPRLIYSDYNSIFLFEKLNAADGIQKKKLQDDLLLLLVSNYLYFHTEVNLENAPFKYLYSVYNINFSYLRATYSQIIHPIRLFKLHRIFMESNIFQSKVGKYLIHKDLKNYQNIMHNDESIFFIDFANTNYETKWIMADIVDLAFSLDTYKLNYNLINTYLANINSNNINIYYQIRFILVRKFLYYINYHLALKKQVKEELAFLDKTLLEETSYKKWLKENGF